MAGTPAGQLRQMKVRAALVGAVRTVFWGALVGGAELLGAAILDGHKTEAAHHHLSTPTAARLLPLAAGIAVTAWVARAQVRRVRNLPFTSTEQAFLDGKASARQAGLV